MSISSCGSTIYLKPYFFSLSSSEFLFSLTFSVSFVMFEYLLNQLHLLFLWSHFLFYYLVINALVCCWRLAVSSHPSDKTVQTYSTQWEWGKQRLETFNQIPLVIRNRRQLSFGELLINIRTAYMYYHIIRLKQLDKSNS